MLLVAVGYSSCRQRTQYKLPSLKCVGIVVTIPKIRWSSKSCYKVFLVAFIKKSCVIPIVPIIKQMSIGRILIPTFFYIVLPLRFYFFGKQSTADWTQHDKEDDDARA